MKLSYKKKRIAALCLLLVGLPLYIFAVIVILNHIGRVHKLIELVIYIFLGIVWVFPVKFIFLGIGKENLDN